MSTEATMSFAKRLTTDEDFQTRAAAAVEGKTGAEAADALIELGTAEGIDVTREELGTIEQALSPSAELSEDQLEGVAGGTNFFQQWQQMQSKISKAQQDAANAIIGNIG